MCPVPLSSFIGRHIGPYRLDALVGSDNVYRALDTRLQRTVAVKVLPHEESASADSRHRFEREARAIAGLRHPHICVLHDIGHADGVDFLVMEFLEGTTLAEKLREGPLPLDQLFQFGIQIASALDETHRHGVIHRNLKPSNLMLTTSGPKLLDFGFAKLWRAGLSPDGSAGEIPATRPSLLLGDSPYSAPEQVERRQVDGRADLFALGAILYEMATGTVPFKADSEAGVVAAILNREPPSPATIRPQIPSALDHVIRRCLIKDPDGRWQTALDLVEELKWAAEATQAMAATTAPTYGRRRSRVFGWTLAALLAIAVAAAVFSSRNDEDGPQSDQASEVNGRLAFAEPLPQDVTLSRAVGQSIPALSPDGRRLAFVGRQGGVARLWVRSFDSPEAHAVAGTDNASFPFWSPDGRSIGFFDDVILKVVDLTSGSVRRVCEPCSAAEPRGATWTSNGKIVSGVNYLFGLMQVPASGGQWSRATTLADATAHRFPTFLPDGRLLYLSMPSKMIWLASAEAGTAVPLVRSDSQALYAAGWLLFTRQGTLLAQRFDASLSALSGEPIPIARNVFTDPSGGAAFSASPDGAIAYRTDPHNGMTQFKWIDRNGRPLEDVGAPGHYRNPVLSPDGTRIAVEVTNAQNGTQDVWLINADSGEASPFASDAANERYPVWSPDGQSILFASERGDHRVIRFLQKRVDGSSDEVVEWTSEVSVVPYGWAPKGDILVLSMSSRLAGLFFKPERMARTLDGESGPIQSHGQVSPNGQWIAYNDYTKVPTQVYVQRFPMAGNSRRQVSTNGGGYVRWRQDGKELVYYRLDGMLVSVTVSQTATGLEVGPEVPLFEAGMLNGPTFAQLFRAQYDIAPDGRFLLNSILDASPSFTVVLRGLPPSIPR